MLNNQKSTNFGFDVDPNENYLYFIPNMSSLYLSVLNATDGMYVSSRKSNSYQIAIKSVVLTASPDNSTVFFTSISGYYFLWKTNSSDLNFYWVTFVSEGGAHKILALDSYQYLRAILIIIFYLKKLKNGAFASYSRQRLVY